MDDEEGYKYTKTDACAVIFAIALVGFGYIFSKSIESTIASFPEGFGPPAIIVWMPMIMCSIPLIICIYLIATADKRARAKSGSSSVYRYRDETLVYTGDYEIHSQPKPKTGDAVYLIPANCPSCNGSLDSDSVDWIGPLQAKCPHCGATVEAEMRE